MVIVGEYDLSGDGENLKPVARPVKRMIIHRNYNAHTFENDIALLELETPLGIQPHVLPICLPNLDEQFVGRMAFVAGWGKLTYGNLFNQKIKSITTDHNCFSFSIFYC